MLARETVRLSAVTNLVHPAVTIDAISEDPDDNRILECAVAAQSAFIISGDNHLPRLGTYNGIRILKVVDFMALLPTT